MSGNYTECSEGELVFYNFQHKNIFGKYSRTFSRRKNWFFNWKKNQLKQNKELLLGQLVADLRSLVIDDPAIILKLILRFGGDKFLVRTAPPPTQVARFKIFYEKVSFSKIMSWLELIPFFWTLNKAPAPHILAQQFPPSIPASHPQLPINIPNPNQFWVSIISVA